MANQLKTGLAFLTAQVQAYMSDEVTYIRGVDTCIVLASLDRQIRQSDALIGISTEFELLSVVIANDLSFRFGASPVIPQRGDLIYLPLTEVTNVYEVMPRDNGPPWTWADPVGQTAYRIYVKQIRVEDI